MRFRLARVAIAIGVGMGTILMLSGAWVHVFH